MMEEISVDIAVEKLAEVSHKAPGYIRDKLHLHGEGNITEQELSEYAQDLFFLTHGGNEIDQEHDFNEKAVRASADSFAHHVVREALRENSLRAQRAQMVAAKKKLMEAELKKMAAKRLLKEQAREREDEEANEERKRAALHRAQQRVASGAADNYTQRHNAKAA